MNSPLKDRLPIRIGFQSFVHWVWKSEQKITGKADVLQHKRETLLLWGRIRGARNNSRGLQVGFTNGKYLKQFSDHSLIVHYEKLIKSSDL